MSTQEQVEELAALINDNTHRFTDGYHLAEIILAAGYERRRDHVAEAAEVRKQARG